MSYEATVKRQLSPPPVNQKNFAENIKKKQSQSSSPNREKVPRGCVSLNVSTGSNTYSLFETLVKEKDDWRFTISSTADVMILNNHPWSKLVFRKDQIVNRYPNMCQIGRKDVFQRIVTVAEHFN